MDIKMSHEELWQILTTEMGCGWGDHTFNIDCEDYTLTLKRPKNKDIPESINQGILATVKEK